MSDRWELLHADAEETRLFCDLEAARRRVTGPAAPPNRFRQVHRIEVDGRCWFLKEFRHTQFKNRLRGRLTAPRCELDGEREHRIAQALEARGFAVARPVAWGRHDGASYYLCAELAGTSLGDLGATGRLDPDTALAAARFCGTILRSGVYLPDLSVDHVFVTDAGFAVIDLHNGGLRPTRSPRRLAKILRRFVKSLRGIALPRQLALRCAWRFLASAGIVEPAARRRILARVPPMDTHGRYEVPGKSRAYAQRNPRRTRRELALLARVWPGDRGEVVLDSPAGAGRLAETLTQRFGTRRIAVDRARAMLLEAGGADAAPAIQADAAALPFVDDAVDGVVVFRFLHHLDAAAARVVVEEAARVAQRYVVLSFFHPVSLHGWTRWIRGRLSGRARTRFGLRPATLRAWLRAAGFAQDAVAADCAYLRDFWVVAFVRT